MWAAVAAVLLVDLVDQADQAAVEALLLVALEHLGKETLEVMD
jgi:hypothetical protein